jgi:hypothetical protein
MKGIPNKWAHLQKWQIRALLIKKWRKNKY